MVSTFDVAYPGAAFARSADCPCRASR